MKQCKVVFVTLMILAFCLATAACGGQGQAGKAGDLQKYYAENLPAIPLYWDTLIQPYSSKWTGWKKDPMYGVLNEETWFNLKKVAEK